MGEDAYEVGRGGADAESPGDAEEKVLPEEDRGLGPVAALPREGLEPGAEVGAVRVVPPGDGAHLRPHRRLPPDPGPGPLAGSHSNREARRCCGRGLGRRPPEPEAIRIAEAGLETGAEGKDRERDTEEKQDCRNGGNFAGPRFCDRCSKL